MTENKGDLISRKALKEEINKKKVVGRFNTIALIDNAPSVNPYFPLSEEVFNYITDAEFEHSDGFYIVTPSGKKIEFEKKRERGEWKEGENGNITCNKCGCEIRFSYLIGNKPDLPKFCCDCGAPMTGANNG